MIRRLLHAIYAIEFLIAVIAVYTVWSEVGGQGHLDYMAWYWKAAIGLTAAYGIVRLTVIAASDHPKRKQRLVLWAVLLALLAICAGIVTYYYHLIEPQDQDEEDPGTTTPAAWHARQPRVAPAHLVRLPASSVGLSQPSRRGHR